MVCNWLHGYCLIVPGLLDWHPLKDKIKFDVSICPCLIHFLFVKFFSHLIITGSSCTIIIVPAVPIAEASSSPSVFSHSHSVPLIKVVESIGVAQPSSILTGAGFYCTTNCNQSSLSLMIQVISLCVSIILYPSCMRGSNI